MKKSWTMRVGVALVALTLVTSCFVGGTFAKYITSDNAADTARVAKWGVEVAAWDDSLFSTSYETGNETVVSSTTEKLVAPGTKNDTGISFSVTGSPEVSTKIEFDMTVTSDVILPAADATYLDWTTAGNAADKFDLANDYKPVVFTLKKGAVTVATGSLADIKAYLEGSTVSKTYAPNANLSTELGTYKLTWAWDFDDSGAGTNDKADTLLGNVVAGKDTSTYTGVSTDIDFAITIKAVQVD